MCGRYLLTTPVDALAALFGFQGRPNLAPRWNIAPTQEALVIQPGADGGRDLAFLRWGLVPAWAKDPTSGPPLINARGETVAEKPSFRDAFRAGRCIAPADGFYEWSGKGKEKRAYYVKPEGPVGFAAISTRWRNPTGDDIESFAIVTTDAAGPLATVHHRTPVVVPLNQTNDWLSGSPQSAHDLIRPPPDDLFELVEVDSRVGNVREDDPGLIAPKPHVAEADDQEKKNDQMSLF